MTRAEFEQASPTPGTTRIRHCDGPEGIYVGYLITGRSWLIVDDGFWLRRTWHLDDCEVIQ